jgi:sterol desaturase/sphingolipid hydroxylase (fatty acid hydroxylase superfamily)
LVVFGGLSGGELAGNALPAAFEGVLVALLGAARSAVSARPVAMKGGESPAPTAQASLVPSFDILPKDAPPGLFDAFGIIALGLLLIGAPLLVLELWRLRRTGALTKARLKGMATSAFCLLPASLVEAVGAGALAALFFAAAALSPFEIRTTWASAGLCLLLVDFLYYWEHRLAHEVNALWSIYHRVHHSANHYDQTIGLRISFADFFFSPLIYLPLAFAGFHPALIFSCFAVALAWQQWIHTELVGKLPLLDPWLNTPSNHRVHHGRNERYLDRNYGGVMMIWDRLFGTYTPESEQVDYGLVDPQESTHPIAVHFEGWGKLASVIRAAPNIRVALAVAFGKPRRSGDSLPIS